MMTKAEKRAAMLAIKAKAMEKMIPCVDCHTEFHRKSLTAKRCDECQAKHKKKLARDYRALHPRKPKIPAEAGTTNLKPAPAASITSIKSTASSAEPTLGAPRVKEPSPTATVIANETCNTCGDYYFPGVTGIDGECRKCFDKRKPAPSVSPAPEKNGNPGNDGKNGAAPEQAISVLPSPVLFKLLVDVMEELTRARQLHPNWPKLDPVFQASIVAEEAGELVKAANTNRIQTGNLLRSGPTEQMRKEALHTIVTAARVILEG